MTIAATPEPELLDRIGVANQHAAVQALLTRDLA